MRCGTLVGDEIARYHDNIRSIPNRDMWLVLTEPLRGYSDDRPAIQHGGPEPLELRNCACCHSTLSRIYRTGG